MHSPVVELPASAARESARQELLLEALRRFGSARLTVTGASMLPAIWPGDVVTVRSCEPAELRPGEVVSFWRGEFLVSHRIQSLLGGGVVITRGDSARHCDPPLNPADILGCVVAIERTGRRVSPVQSVWQRAAAAVLRRSDFCTRTVLFLHRRTCKVFSSRRDSSASLRAGYDRGEELAQQNSTSSVPLW